MNPKEADEIDEYATLISRRIIDALEEQCVCPKVRMVIALVIMKQASSEVALDKKDVLEFVNDAWFFIYRGKG